MVFRLHDLAARASDVGTFLSCLFSLAAALWLTWGTLGFLFSGSILQFFVSVGMLAIYLPWAAFMGFLIVRQLGELLGRW